MKKKWTMFACAAMAAVMGSALFVSCGGSKNYAENNEKFYIGASGPLTGGAAVYGKAVQNGAQLAVEEINAAGGLDGKQFEFVMMDDSNDDTRVNSNYASLYEKGMQVSLGCVTTKPCLAFKQLAEEDNLFFLTPSATGDDVIGGGNAYQMCFSDSGQGTAAAEYVRENVTESTIGIFYKSDDPYSNGIYQNFISALGKNSNFTFVTTSFTDDTNADFSSQINRLKDCKFIFMPIYTEPASLFMMQAKESFPTMPPISVVTASTESKARLRRQTRFPRFLRKFPIFLILMPQRRAGRPRSLSTAIRQNTEKIRSISSGRPLTTACTRFMRRWRPRFPAERKSP